jgi:hypothetical protein
MFFNKAVEFRPRHMLQNPMKYSILMPHGVDPFRCPDTSLNARDTGESTSCALSTKIEPDSRGFIRAIHQMDAPHARGMTFQRWGKDAAQRKPML